MRNFKEIQRFNEIADILGIKFEEAEDLSRVVRKETIELNKKIEDYEAGRLLLKDLEIHEDEK